MRLTYIATAFFTAAILTAGCATGPGSGLPEALPDAGLTGEEVTDEANGYVQPRVTLLSEPATLGQAVREIGEEVGGSLVLMNGAERFPLADSIRLRSSNYESAARRLAKASGCAVQHTPHYFFLYPASGPYDVLTQFDLTGRLHARYGGIRAGMQMPAGLELFNAFARVSEALDITVVADAVICEGARTGELTLGMIPLPAALEAILKSARVPNAGVDSTDEYVFFHAPNNSSPRSMLLNGGQIAEQMRAFLTQKVNVALPAPGPRRGVVPQFAGAKILDDVLPELSRQLGVEVVAGEGLGQIPINPVVMRNVTVAAALDLLIRQWPEPRRFGYHALPGRIVIARRGAQGS